ncbi:FecCD family ABC transporter permease [Paenibacillus caui]|uniref:FecCD family ABC transporter permease n=1 Tax=Paenibacillus caui TaxID=2873927 RepID=UPI001CA9223F|nr:iron ABC transporter permease [Paenibacillus caui]
MVLLIAIVGSLSVGVASISWKELVEGFKGADSKSYSILMTIRLPRTVASIIVGANLAVAGALMQAMLRNPLASPQVFGINSGASLIVVAAVAFLPNIGSSNLIYLAFLGAVLGGAIVYSFSAKGGMTPVKLALAGMAVHLLLASVTQSILIFDERISDVLYWLAGSVDRASWSAISIVWPWSVAGLLFAIALSRPVSLLSLGGETAEGLGLNVRLMRLIIALIVVILAGASVSLAGAIGFVGLMVPNIVKMLVGENYSRVLPLSALCGAGLLTLADVLGRFIAYPYESPVGIVTALLGGPFFLYLAVSKGKGMK